MNCRSSSLLQMIFAMRIRCGVVIVRDDAKFMGYTGRVLGTYDEHTMIKSLPVKKKRLSPSYYFQKEVLLPLLRTRPIDFTLTKLCVIEMKKSCNYNKKSNLQQK